MQPCASDRASAVERAEQLAGIGTWTLDIASGEVVSNSTIRSLLEVPEGADAPSFASWLSFVHPDDRPSLRARFRELVEHGSEYDVQHRLVLPGGRLKHVRAVATASLGEDGRPVTAHGITFDVTPERLSAAEVEGERDRSRAVLARLHEGFALLAGEVLMEVNPALCGMTGFAEGELVGSGPPYPFWSPDGPDLLAVVADGTRSVEAEVDLVRADGTVLPAAVAVVALPSVGPVRLRMLVVRDLTEQRAYEQVLLVRAETDPLTGVLNSRAFRDLLRSAVDEARRGELPLSLALIDVDDYKDVNDQHGHAVGDEVLQALVARFSAVTAGEGTLARVGGDEFALLLPGRDAEAARPVLEAALAALRAAPLSPVGVVTASVGLAEHFGSMDDDALYRLADALLYEAKARGRDQVR